VEDRIKQEISFALLVRDIPTVAVIEQLIVQQALHPDLLPQTSVRNSGGKSKMS